MKFRWKLMIETMLIVSFSFGFGGMLLIQYSYHASIKQEKKSARNSYEMILRMLKEIDEMDDTYQNQTFASVLKRLNRQGILRDSSVRLLKEDNGVTQIGTSHCILIIKMKILDRARDFQPNRERQLYLRTK